MVLPMRLLRLLLLLLLLLLAATPALAAPVAEQGTIDLRHAELEAAGPVALRGHWLFYRDAFVAPTADSPSAAEPTLIRTPATWGSAAPDYRDQGYGTYRLRILLSDNDVGRTLGLYLPSIASAYDLYINGAKLASAGAIGTSRADMKPSAMPQTLYFVADSHALDVVVHVSNFNQRKGGMWSEMKLGTAAQIAKEREHRTLFQTFIASGLLLIGIYHIGYYFYRREKSTLYFGLASLCLFLRNILVGEMLAVQMFPALPWELLVKLEYTSVFVGISFLLLYFYHLYNSHLHRTVSYGLALLMIGISLPIAWLPARIYTQWLNGYLLILLLLVLYITFGLVRAAYRRYPGARMNLLVGLIFLSTVLNDIFYYTFWIDTIDLVTLGLFLFIFTQMFMLARKFASAFTEAEKLKIELETYNAQLETIVESRTKALHRSNLKLKEAEQTRTNLLSSIAHELGNPLTSIIGYLRRLKDGESRDDAQRHIDIAYRKALKLERLTDDLRQLVKLETDRFTYELREFAVAELYRELRQCFDWTALERKIELKFDDDKAADFAIMADVSRMEQVLANLIDNALAYTNPEDRITITGRVFRFANVCAITVQDTGTGIRKEDQSRLFERFYRVRHPDGDTREGSGLGLSIASVIVEAHRGKIGVRAEYGVGSTFYVLLPVMHKPAPRPAILNGNDQFA